MLVLLLLGVSCCTFRYRWSSQKVQEEPRGDVEDRNLTSGVRCVDAAKHYCCCRLLVVVGSVNVELGG